MDSLEVSDDVFQVGVRNPGLVEGGHGGFAFTHLVAHEIGIDGVLADAQLWGAPGLRALTKMAPGAGLGKDQSSGLGLGVGLSG